MFFYRKGTITEHICQVVGVRGGVEVPALQLGQTGEQIRRPHVEPAQSKRVGAVDEDRSERGGGRLEHAEFWIVAKTESRGGRGDGEVGPADLELLEHWDGSVSKRVHALIELTGPEPGVILQEPIELIRQRCRPGGSAHQQYAAQGQCAGDNPSSHVCPPSVRG